MARMPPTVLAHLHCDEPTARKLAACFGGQDEAVAAAFEADRGWALEITFVEPPDQEALRALVGVEAGAAAASALEFAAIAEQDWVGASLAGLKPVRAGRFVVHGAHDRRRLPPNAIGIEIEAALAFGTGHHGTTRGCLLALEAYVKARRQTPIPPLKGEGRTAEGRSGWRHLGNPHPARFTRHPPPFRGRNKKILDVGTGTGVLAIAAAKALRVRIVASDIDPVAVATAKANARHNGVGALIALRQADGRRGLPGFFLERGPFDLILANILLGPLIRMARRLAQHLAPTGRIVLSGLLPDQSNAALAAYRAQGLALERRIVLENWVTLVLRRG
jgi:ribosomal protein L11 methyltransferase